MKLLVFQSFPTLTCWLASISDYYKPTVTLTQCSWSGVLSSYNGRAESPPLDSWNRAPLCLAHRFQGIISAFGTCVISHSNLKLVTTTSYQSFEKRHDLKKYFELGVCYFPSFPFNLEHVARRHSTWLVLWVMWSLFKSWPLQESRGGTFSFGQIIVCSGSLWGKEGVEASSFQLRVAVSVLPPRFTFAEAVVLEDATEVVHVLGGGKAGCNPGHCPGRLQWDLMICVPFSILVSLTGFSSLQIQSEGNLPFKYSSL